MSSSTRKFLQSTLEKKNANGELRGKQGARSAFDFRSLKKQILFWIVATTVTTVHLHTTVKVENKKNARSAFDFWEVQNKCDSLFFERKKSISHYSPSCPSCFSYAPFCFLARSAFSPRISVFVHILHLDLHLGLPERLQVAHLA